MKDRHHHLTKGSNAKHHKKPGHASVGNLSHLRRLGRPYGSPARHADCNPRSRGWHSHFDRQVIVTEVALGFDPLSVVNTAVIDRKFAAAVIGIDFDESFAKTNVPPRVVVLCLHSRSNNRIDSNN